MQKRSAMDYFWIALKGFAMGVANVIPGVSGGTIALVTGIYQELINSLKCFNGKALQLLYKREFSQLATHLNIKFLAFLLSGVVLSVFSIAKLFSFLLEEHPVQIWAYFFGLILASVYYVGKTVSHWDFTNKSFLAMGVALALFIAFSNPSPAENGNYFYILFCGVIGISGMLLPGLSGSYILMLMGNYRLLMVDSINAVSDSVKMLLTGDLSFLNNPDLVQGLINFGLFLAGSIFGMISFSQLIAWVFERYKNTTIALLTGFVFGSLAIIWPWKSEIYHPELLNRYNEPLIIGFQRYIPSECNTEVLWALACMAFGVLCIWLLEKLAEDKKT